MQGTNEKRRHTGQLFSYYLFLEWILAQIGRFSLFFASIRIFPLNDQSFPLNDQSLGQNPEEEASPLKRPLDCL